jgi:tRNA dimethylallyltransferase
MRGGCVEKIVAITGITASGKTALSVAIAKKFNGEIVSADSRQVYKFLDIGTAKITAREMDGIPHHMLDIVDPRDSRRYSVGDFVRDAIPIIDDIIKRGKLPVLVGGTGLYSRSVINGYCFGGQNKPKYDTLQICLVPPKEIIAPKVAARIEARIADGMTAETKRLLSAGVSREFLFNLGLEYRLNVLFLENKIDSDQYRKLLFNQSMQFIKRQRTWYRKENPAITHYLTDPKQYLSRTYDLIKKHISGGGSYKQQALGRLRN